MISNRRDRSAREARLVIRTSWPPHTASSSACCIMIGTRMAGLQCDDAVITDLAKQQETAVAKNRECRHRRFREPGPSGRERARAKTKILRAADHLRNADRHSAILMTNLLGIDANPLKPKHHHQRDQTGIRGQAGRLAVVLQCYFPHRKLTAAHFPELFASERSALSPIADDGCAQCRKSP